MLKEKRLILKNAGKFNPLDMDAVIRHGGYEVFKSVLKQTPEDLQKAIEKSGLKGRGGAGFPTGFKVQATSDAEAICLKYVVCNADEGEPGTYKDRIIMEQTPHQVIEGMLIAAKTIGAIWGYIYIRGEYYEAIEKMQLAISQAEAANLLGNNILGTDFSFKLEIMLGAGSYLCGEELTLLESLEGKRGYPRIKPPFPAEKGLWGQPTLVNNVETLANLPIMFEMGFEEYLKIGTEKSPGTKLICLSGDIKYPGTYELELGCTLQEVINDIGGGVHENRRMKAILIGGAAGTFANPNQLKYQMGYAELREHGLTLGSGAIMVFSDKSSLSKIITSILEFFKHESCGKCVPCRVGTHHIYEKWKAVEKDSIKNKIDVLHEIKIMAEEIAASSLCPLGQSPILPIKSFIDNCLAELD